MMVLVLFAVNVLTAQCGCLLGIPGNCMLFRQWGPTASSLFTNQNVCKLGGWLWWETGFLSQALVCGKKECFGANAVIG
ncbi:hypothetical protein B0T13DRAFT_475293 [Neurospora crassa]|nr:hypothetical protein B0T13DRAFT_475293 [Neurospora crassa]